MVSRKHVVTAAHCNFLPETVGLGAHNKRNKSEHVIVKIAKVTTHPGN